jgi:hypothetical protein
VETSTSRRFSSGMSETATRGGWLTATLILPRLARPQVLCYLF